MHDKIGRGVEYFEAKIWFFNVTLNWSNLTHVPSLLYYRINRKEIFLVKKKLFVSGNKMGKASRHSSYFQ